MSQEVIINAQVALYFNGLIGKPGDIWQDLDSKLGNISEGPPLILPVPNEPALHEAPVVQFFSATRRVNVSRKRIDLFIAGVGRKADFSSVRNDLIDKAQILMEEIKKMVPIKWIGFVARFFLEEENPAAIISNVLADKLKDIAQGSVKESSVRYVAIDRSSGFKINNIVEVVPFKARIAGYGNDIPGILITRDFNTKPEENLDASKENLIKNFILECEGKFKINEMKSLLWP